MKQPPVTTAEILGSIEDMESLGHLYDILQAAAERIYCIGHKDGQRPTLSEKGRGSIRVVGSQFHRDPLTRKQEP